MLIVALEDRKGPLVLDLEAGTRAAAHPVGTRKLALIATLARGCALQPRGGCTATSPARSPRGHCLESPGQGSPEDAPRFRSRSSRRSCRFCGSLAHDDWLHEPLFLARGPSSPKVNADGHAFEMRQPAQLGFFALQTLRP